MDELVLSSISSYYHTLEKIGYLSYSHVMKLLLLLFYRDFVFEDYRGFLSREDYLLIERALNCLFGTTCLIPYPDYLKMGKLHLGEMTELAQRVKTIEDTDVVKVIHDTEDDGQSDIIVTVEDGD